MIGVVYKFQPHNKLNGSLFYGFEYATLLGVPLYIVGISDKDLRLVLDIFENKYAVPIDNIVPTKVTELYFLNLDQTLVLDIRSFYSCKEFLTNDIHVFSNEPHPMFRYRDNRTVTYYGSYPDYQNYDVFNYLKLNFSIFKRFEAVGNQVFVSGMVIEDGYQYPDPNKGAIIKKHHSGVGNIFELVDTVHYIHTKLDTNNRIIPEAFFYGKTVTMEDHNPSLVDSTTYRYEDILTNGLDNYTLTTNDEMIKACLKSNN